ncbi:MAG TPA: DUF362 domain-containing protein [Syntrophorhabdaceae bacterium]
MASPVSLKKGQFSRPFLGRFLEHYSYMGAEEYAAAAWRLWAERPGTVVLRGTFGGMLVGWIVYDPSRSTVLEIVAREEEGAADLEASLLDALIERENLVAALVREADREKYRRMIAYGFRPVGTIQDHGYSLVKMELSTAVLLEKLKGAQPWKPYKKNEKVAIDRTPGGATDDEIAAALESLFRKLGGIRKFVKPGQHVVIKPNLVSDHGLKDGSYKGGIVTDIRVVRALTKLLLPIAGRITIAEGSSINRSETSKMFALYGYDSLVQLDKNKVQLVDLNGDELIEKAVPGQKRMASRKIPLTLEKADVIISVPVLKIHFAAIASLAVKHLQGAVPPLEKYMSHFFGLWQSLINIHHVVKPKLTIIDGLTGQEDFGPVSGVPKAMNLLIGGTNPVAVDAVAMRIMGLDPATSPPVWMAYMQGLGPIEEEKISVLGPSVVEVGSPFAQPAIDLRGGKDILVHGESACPGCRGYLHFVLSKLNKADPMDPDRRLIDRPFEQKVNIYLGHETEKVITGKEKNIFMGLCQQHHKDLGPHLPGCPPHAEVIMDGIFSLFPDVERPQYADKTEETRLGEMLSEILDMGKV